MEMPFGKYRGVELEDIPISYLKWVLRTVPLTSQRLREEMEELAGEEATAEPEPSSAGSWGRLKATSYTVPPRPAPRCKSCGVDGFLDCTGRCGVCASDPAGEWIEKAKVRLRDAINKWRRSMAAKYHPDRGGDELIMSGINDAGDALIRCIEETLKAS